MASHDTPSEGLIWANLLHLSFNMWEDRVGPGDELLEIRGYRPYLQFDDTLWHDALRRMSEVGMNMVIIDLGDGVSYASHPEIAVENAWTTGRLREELEKIRELGIEPIPKLNFATTHDAWLGEYSRRVSTDVYYEVCEDLISEVVDLFDTPRFFHLGMDEETAEHQRYYNYVVVRQHELFWHDFHFYCDRVAAAGVRPWVWSDYLWHHPASFTEQMPRSVLQSNWYYGLEFDPEDVEVKAYHELEKGGFDQIPTGSNHSHPENFGRTVEYCTRLLDPGRLLGFMQTPWRPTTERFRQRHIDAIEQVGVAIREIGLPP